MQQHIEINKTPITFLFDCLPPSRISYIFHISSLFFSHCLLFLNRFLLLYHLTVCLTAMKVICFFSPHVLSHSFLGFKGNCTCL